MGKHYCLELSTGHDLWLEHATKKMFWIGHEARCRESCIMFYIWKFSVPSSHLTITTTWETIRGPRGDMHSGTDNQQITSSHSLHVCWKTEWQLTDHASRSVWNKLVSNGCQLCLRWFRGDERELLRGWVMSKMLELTTEEVEIEPWPSNRLSDTVEKSVKVTYPAF